MTNRQSDCAEQRYLLWQSQKSSPPSTAITTGPLSPGATRHVTGVTKEIDKARAIREAEEEEEEKVEGGMWG